MKQTKSFLTLTFLITALFVNAQTNSLRLNPTIVLPEDSIESKNLTTALNDFLLSAQKPNEENKFILESEKIETFILLDEINGIEKSEKYKDHLFYKPYLTNVMPLKDNQYLLQVSYIGTNENVAYLRASFEFIAHKTGTSFVFSSPLLRNTKNWRVERAGNNIFHYQNTINKEKVKEFNKLASSFDFKLKSKNKTIDFYCTDNIVELEKLIGVEYKADYNGRTESVWSSSLGDRKLIVFGNNNANFNYFDPHDLWHDRMFMVVPREKYNKVFDEGCAHLYGGSWGLTWNEIWKMFTERVSSDKKKNWLEEFGKFQNFGDSPQKHLRPEYIISALIVKKVEKEQGFDKVLELITSGPYERNNIKYFETLEKVTGITKANFNEEVWKLINNEK